MSVFPIHMVPLIAKLFSGSQSVQNEVLKNLPVKINFELRAEFDNANNLVIFAFSPENQGLITEATNFDDTIKNCCDAILTYFDVPREYARLVEYKIIEQTDAPRLIEDDGSSVKNISLNKEILCA